MAKKKKLEGAKAGEGGQAETTAPAPAAPAKEKAKSKEEARVTCPNPALNRTYSLERHGKDFGNLANQYAGKNGCSVE